MGTTPLEHAGASAGDDGSRDIARLTGDDLLATIELAPLGIAHFRPDGRFTMVNEKLRAILGYTRDELLGVRFDEITHPDDRATCLSLNAQLAAGTIESYHHDKRFIRADGESLWTRVTVSAVRRDGQLAYFVGIAEDVSAQYAAEAELKASEARFRALANAIPQMAWISDAEGRRSWYNDRWFEFTGLTFDELRDFGWRSLHHPEHIERVERSLLAAMASGEPWEETFPLRRHDGVFRWFLTRAVPVTVERDQTFWLATNTDITERLDIENEIRSALDRERQARTLAEESKRLRDVVMGLVAHDLRNPVHTVVMSSSILLELDLPPEERERQLGIIKRSAKSMDRLLNDLLDVSRIEAGSFAIEAGSADPASLYGTVMDLFEARARSRQVALECDASHHPAVRGDAGRLVQVLSNLVSNALKFTPAGGRIVLRTSAEVPFVRFTVEDNGCGIPSDDLDKIFQRFWKAEQGSKVGAGLGLFISKAIVEAHGGEMRVESGVNRGTAFHFTIPTIG